MITVYSKPSCVQCTATKKHLDRMGIDYRVVDVTEDPEAYDRLLALGFRAMPVVETPDNRWAGYNPGMLDQLA